MSIQLFFDKYARNIRFLASASTFFFIFCLGGCAGSTHTGPAPKVDKNPIKIPLKHRLAAIGLGPRKPKALLSRAPLAIGLALGGGAARGFAHIGVIQVLEENGIKPDLVVGTSAGALAASMYAMGKSGQAMQQIAEDMDESMMTDWTIPFFNRGGVLRGDAYTKFAGEQVGYQSIEQAKIPLGIVATDLNTGHGVLFRGGDIATAVRASSAVPGIFSPVTIDEVDYVDGGLTSPVPVRYARQMGATVVIAVDISAAPDGEASEGMLEILLKTFTIMAKSINDFELKNAEITVRPHLVGVGSSNFSAKRRAIEAGRLAMLAELPKLKALLL